MKMQLLTQLTRIRDEGPFDTNHGICYNINEPDLENLFRDIALKWPKHSKDFIYPIQDSEVKGSAQWQFISADANALWESTLGELRYELINFVIKELEDDLGISTATEHDEEAHW